MTQKNYFEAYAIIEKQITIYKEKASGKYIHSIECQTYLKIMLALEDTQTAFYNEYTKAHE